MEDWLTEDLLDELGFKVEKDDGKYGKAICKRSGMTVIEWNREGHSCTYFGDPLTDNISLGIGKDGGTRYAFNGYVYNEEDFRKVLSLTW
tara:strand:- start:4256 stop:4525 length:270 start_codon:yes stop_codon:yes gene_type:complete